MKKVVLTVIALLIISATVWGIFEFVKRSEENPEVGNTIHYSNDISFIEINGELIANCKSKSVEYLLIPSEYKGMPVVEVGNFSECPKLKSVIIEEGVKVISERAFADNPALTEIQLPSNIEVIEKDAFVNCGYYQNEDNRTNGALYIGEYLIKSFTKSESFTIKEGTIGVADNAFAYLFNIKEMYVPSSVKYFGKDCFLNDWELYDINVRYDGTVSQWCDIEFANKYSNPSVGGKIYIQGELIEKQQIMPEGIEEIKNYAFYGSDLELLVFPNSLKRIGDFAFADCDNLRKITINKGIEHIGDSVFHNCHLLQQIDFDGTINQWSTVELQAPSSNPFYYTDYFYINGEIPSGSIVIDSPEIKSYTFSGANSITALHTTSQVRSIGRSAFKECESLQEVYLAEGLKEISDYAFYNCNDLKTVVLPESVTGLGTEAFYGAEKLNTVTLPDGITYLGNKVFWGGADFDNPDNWQDECFYLQDYLIGVSLLSVDKVTIKDNVRLIADEAFKGSRVTEVVFPSSVNEINLSLFDGVDYLTTLRFGQSVKKINIDYFTAPKGEVSVYFDGSFDQWCDIEYSVELDRTAFFHSIYCDGELVEGEITLPTTPVVNAYLFSGYNKVTSVTIPEGVEKIECGAFSNCLSLREVKIASSVNSIDGAFSGCTNLKNITLQQGLTSITNGAFGFNENIDTVNFLGDINDWLNVQMDEQTNFMCNVKQFFVNDSIWEGVLEVPEGITEISNYAFPNQTGLESVILPDSVTEIGDMAFYNCTNLLDVTLPYNLEEIGYSAFAYCVKLQSVSFYDKLQEIGERAFYYTAIKEVVVPDCVKYIGPSAFGSCNSLESIKLGKGIEVLEHAISAGSINLAYVIISANLKEVAEYSGFAESCIYYEGTKEEFGKIQIDPFTRSIMERNICYYSKDPVSDHNYWHYDNDGEPVKW